MVFTVPDGPTACAGAAQKPMYLACDYWRSKGVLDDIRVVLLVPGRTVFGIPMIDEELDRKIAEYGIELRTQTELLAVDGAARTITVGARDAAEHIEYDVLHVVPPQSAPDWLKGSELAVPDDDSGFVDVDSRTLRHRRFANVWALGDAAATTNSKSGGALRKQTKVLAENLVAVLAGRSPGAAVQRVLRRAIHGVATHGGVRGVRRSVPSEADHPVLALARPRTAADVGVRPATSCPGSTGT